MATTSYVDSTFSVDTIGARTDAAGAGVTDVGAEELRFGLAAFTEGALRPNIAFRVQAQSTPDMTVKVGSGVARQDFYVVSGQLAGQGNYVARLDVNSVTVPIDAADGSQPRTDEVYLVVLDSAYDSTGRALPRIGYRKGDLAGGNPGPDTAWKASALLARVAVAAGASSITSANITDQRTMAGLSLQGTLTAAAVSTASSDVDTSIADHGHNPIAANMTTTVEPGGWALYYQNTATSVQSRVDRKVPFRSWAREDDLVTKTINGDGDDFTINASGIWTVTATVRYPAQNAGGGGERYAAIREGDIVVAATGFPSENGVPASLNPTWTGYFSVGTIVTVWTFQSSGAPLLTEASPSWQNVSFSLIRRMA